MSGAKLQKAIFLDRDGVINKLLTNHPDRHDPSNYVVRWDQFEFEDGAIKALGLFSETDYKILIVSNQSGIGRGYVDDELFIANKIIRGIFLNMMFVVNNDNDGRIDDYMFCPHASESPCCCRKPQPGMIYSLATKHEIDLSQSWMIGDSDTDIQAGYNAGIRNMVNIRPDVETGFWQSGNYMTDARILIRPNLLKAVEFILKDEPAKT